MKFLKTDDKLEIVETDDFQELIKSFPGSIFDYNFKVFNETIAEYINQVLKYKESRPVLIVFNCLQLEEEEVQYFSDVCFEYLISNIVTDEKKFETDLWQPRTEISEQLNMTKDAQSKILNYKSKIEAFNILFKIKNNVIVEMIKERK